MSLLRDFFGLDAPDVPPDPRRELLRRAFVVLPMLHYWTHDTPRPKQITAHVADATHRVVAWIDERGRSGITPEQVRSDLDFLETWIGGFSS